jgi:hypothetical protein
VGPATDAKLIITQSTYSLPWVHIRNNVKVSHRRHICSSWHLYKISCRLLGTFVTYPQTCFHIPSCNGSLTIDAKPTDRYKLPASALLLFNILPNTLTKGVKVSKICQQRPYNTTTETVSKWRECLNHLTSSQGRHAGIRYDKMESVCVWCCP